MVQEHSPLVCTDKVRSSIVFCKSLKSCLKIKCCLLGNVGSVCSVLGAATRKSHRWTTRAKMWSKLSKHLYCIFWQAARVNINAISLSATEVCQDFIGVVLFSGMCNKRVRRLLSHSTRQALYHTTSYCDILLSTSCYSSTSKEMGTAWKSLDCSIFFQERAERWHP